jgi:hypothetical protein
VSALQMEVDTTGQDGAHASAWERGGTPGTTPLDLGTLGRVPPATLAGSSTLEEPRAGTTASERAHAPVRELVSREPVGYSADPLRHARLAILANRPADALSILENAGESSEIVYWRGRAFEDLGQVEAAIEAYGKVGEDQAATELAARAAQDLAFLQWKRDLDTRRASREARREVEAKGTEERE